MEEFRHKREVAVNLFDISNRRLVRQGTVIVDVLVEDERPRKPFQQEFIVVPEIMEECVLGLDALYEQKFMIDGRERRVYRVRESDQLQNDDKPTMMVAVRTKIPPSSSSVVENEIGDVKLSLDTACFLVKNPRLPAGLRLDSFVSTQLYNGVACDFRSAHPIASCSTRTTVIGSATFEASLPDVAENLKRELRSLLLENHNIFAFQTSYLGNTGLVKHVIDTQGQGLIRKKPYRASLRQREVAKKIINELLAKDIISPSSLLGQPKSC
ncbi:hypothetical protein OUZ56_012475 [Daphnia magna]|uniref:Uncharacterized protein n=1 Tax=Daphnia magna TaxID=35525 RepID=A0ABQ9Z4C4_9CRUS|nr:hypothetical protein OUZ56_012475 [Daphnia magna]